MRKGEKVKWAENCKEQSTLSCVSTSASPWGKGSRTGFTRWVGGVAEACSPCEETTVSPAQGLLDVIIS